jgi:hypothetical protein
MEDPKGHPAAGNGSASGNARAPSPKKNKAASSPNIALEECDEECIPSYSKNTNRSVQKICAPELLSPSTCLVPRSREASFYDAIDWKVLKENLKKYTTLFETTLMEDEALAEDIQTLYTYGPFNRTERPKLYALLTVDPVNNDDFKRCDNLILKITIDRGIYAEGKKKKQVIGHISLHPKLPKFYRDTRRSRDGCGYYKRPDPNNLDTDNDSPFQYVIESVKWKSIEFQFTNPLRPYLPIFADAENPGKFLPVYDTFPQVGMPGFPDGPGKNESITRAEKDLLQFIHIRILNIFIVLWNTVFQVGSANFPKLRRTIGGSRRKLRKTRKLKPSRK